MKMVKKVVALLISVLTLLSLAACGSTAGSTTGNSPAPASSSASTAPGTDPSTAAPETVSKKVLNIGNYMNEVFIGSLDPTGAVVPGVCFGADKLLYDSMLIYDGKGYTSRIFSDWSWKDDTTFVATIKDGVSFSNGDPMTAADIIYTYNMIQTNSWMNVWYNFIDVANSTADGNKLTLKTKFPYALAEFYFSFNGIINDSAFQAALDKAGGVTASIDAFSLDFLTGMGSGAYTLKEMVLDSHAVYTLNKDWWGYKEYGANMFEELDCAVYKDQTTMAVDMETGKLDLALDCSMQDGTRAYNGEMGDGVALGLAPQNACWDVVFNPSSDRTKDLNVRKAIACCLDPATLESATYGDLYGKVSTSIIPQGCDGGYVAPDVIAQYYSYDPAKAAEYLKAAGYEPGELTIQLLVETSSLSTSLAEMIQALLSEGGINCEITVADMQSFANYLDGSNKIDMQIQHSQDNGTASGYSAVSMLSNPRFPEFMLSNYGDYAALLDACMKETDAAKRDTLLKQFVEYGAKECLYVSLFDYSSAYLYNPKVIDISKTYIPSIQTLNMTQVSHY